MLSKAHLILLPVLVLTLLSPACTWGASNDSGPILNTGECKDPGLPDEALVATMNHTFGDLREAGYEVDGRVRYRALRDSAEWDAYEAVVGCLRKFDPGILKTREQKLAFWINTYNVMVVHGVLSAGIPSSVMDVDSFFDNTAYNIGGVRFSLEHVEHGVLRRNSPKYMRPWSPFSKDDPALPYAMEKIEPRIHFALVCAARSCPPLRGYIPATVDVQLDEVTRTFLNRTVRPAPNGNGLEISSILQWFEADFGGRQGVLDLFRRWLEPGAVRGILKSEENPEISYSDYDWGLNDLP